MVPKEVRLQFVRQERATYENTIEVLTIRHRVNKKLGDDNAVKQVTADLEKCEMAILELNKIEEEIIQEK